MLCNLKLGKFKDGFSPLLQLPHASFDEKKFYSQIDGANCEAVIG